MKKLYSPLLIIFLIYGANAQTRVIPSFQDFLFQDSIQIVKAREIALEKGLPMIIESVNGSVAEFQKFDERGFPLYFITDNLEAAKTVSTNKVWNSGDMGLNLSGDSMIIGEWDGGLIRTTHQELNGRVAQFDGASVLSDHATHVGATLIGKGVEANAKGMSYKASLHAYDWNFDEQEMDQEASNGLLISNHSYSNISGWFNNKTQGRWEWYGDTSISDQEDWHFGFYSSESYGWDMIAYNNPNYLMVKSSGNTRTDKLPDTVKTYWIWDPGTGNWKETSVKRPGTGPYDCISGAGVSKNVLTVGAVNAIPNGYSKTGDVVMSSFSSWGPSDDGRIKPDIVGNGVGVYSALSGSDNAYAVYNGTSMSSPNVAGSLLLIQQHYKNLNGGNYMTSAALKGLAIHTADEAGSDPGPDYMFGWGLLNTASAAAFITNTNSSFELVTPSLSNKTSYETTFYSDGKSPLKATISWTDIAGNSPNPSLDPADAMLVNDLDVRVIRISDSTVFKPWVLDPANPANAATTGDNIQDNIEQVFIASPQAGFYRISVTHKGTLDGNNSQDFALLISGKAAGLKADFTSNKVEICEGGSTKFTAKVLGTPTAYEWSVPGAIPSTSTDLAPVFQFPVPGNYDVTLKISSPAAADSMIKMQYIKVQPLPVFTLNPVTQVFCDNDTAAFNLLPLSTPQGVFTGKGVKNNKFIPKQAGKGKIKIYGTYTNSIGCVVKDSLEITVEPTPPVPAITLNGKTLQSSAATGNQWFKNGSILSGDTNSTYTPIASGDYTVKVTAGSCSSLSEKFAYTFTGIAERPMIRDIYPNPSTGIVTIQTGKGIELKKIHIYDSKGALAETVVSGGSETQLSLPDGLNGLVFLRIETTEGSMAYRLVVNR